MMNTISICLINPIQSRAATPNLIQQAIHLEDKETKFPKVTQRVGHKHHHHTD